MKNVTVVILTRNRVADLLRSVEAALALPEQPPVIVVDNASLDGTPRRLKERFPQVRLIRLPVDIGAAARNLGAHCAETPYVAFSDDESEWSPGSLRAAADLLDFYPRIAAVTARVLVGDEGVEDSASIRMAASPLPSKGLPGPAVLGFVPGACVFRRKAFLQAGGYEPRFFLDGEEQLLAYDVAANGWTMVYAERLTVHRYRSKPPDSAARRRRLARNALWVAWLRRPLANAIQLTWEVILENNSLAPLLDALHGAAWVLRNRRAMPRSVEALCRLIEGQAPGPQGFGGIARHPLLRPRA